MYTLCEFNRPYIYAVLSVATESESLDTGTPYAACKTADGSFIPSYEVVQDRFLTEADCAAMGHTFVPSTSPDAILPQTVPTGAVCTANGTPTTPVAEPVGRATPIDEVNLTESETEKVPIAESSTDRAYLSTSKYFSVDMLDTCCPCLLTQLVTNSFE